MCAELTAASAKWSKNGEVITAKANRNSCKTPTDERKRETVIILVSSSSKCSNKLFEIIVQTNKIC